MNDKRDEILDAARIWLNQNCPSRLIKEYDASRLADFTIEYTTAEGIPQADGWVAIETVDDLPKVGGRYLWQFRNVDDGIEFDLRIFKPSMDGQDFVKVFVAWKRPAPYQRKSEGDSK